MDFSMTSVSLSRPVTSYSKTQHLIALLIRNRKRFARLKAPGCYVDLGCGPNTDPSFCNLDFSWRPDIDVCWDVTKGLPFPDAYVRGIFTEHMLEHLPSESALDVLKECRRVLMNDGVLRIIMPDGAIYLREYAKGAQSCMPCSDGDNKRFPFYTAIMSINRLFRDDGHCFIWDVETLTRALTHSGFQNVKECAFGTGRDPRLLRDSPGRKAESLYVEAW